MNRELKENSPEGIEDCKAWASAIDEETAKEIFKDFYMNTNHDCNLYLTEEPLGENNGC